MTKRSLKRRFIVNELEDIDEVKFLMFVVEPNLEIPVKLRIGSLGGRVLSVKYCRGISGYDKIGIHEEKPNYLIFATTRSEDAQNIILAIATEFNFHLPHTGKAWMVDVEGYMGAKGILSE